MTNFFDELQKKNRKDKDVTHDVSKIGETVNTYTHPEHTETHLPPNHNQPVSKHIKLATQELLKYGLLEAQAKPKLYQSLVTHKTQVDAILAPLDLLSCHDEIRGLFFLKVAQEVMQEMAEPSEQNQVSQVNHTTQDEYTEKLDATTLEKQAFGEDDAWSHPLVRKQRLNMEQSLMLAVLRQFYIDHEQSQGVGVGKAMVDVDDIQAHILLYLGESGSDAKDTKRVTDLLDKLKNHGIVSDIDKNNHIIIRPIITHVANPNTLVSLLAHYQQMRDDNSV